VAARHDTLPRTGLGLAAAGLLLEPVRGTRLTLSTSELQKRSTAPGDNFRQKTSV
jgi:hypothetical protein